MSADGQERLEALEREVAALRAANEQSKGAAAAGGGVSLGMGLIAMALAVGFWAWVEDRSGQRDAALEERRFESELISSWAQPPSQAIENLAFLRQVGMLRQSDGAIGAWSEDPKRAYINNAPVASANEGAAVDYLKGAILRYFKVRGAYPPSLEALKLPKTLFGPGRLVDPANLSYISDPNGYWFVAPGGDNVLWTGDDRYFGPFSVQKRPSEPSIPSNPPVPAPPATP